jgi:hypothetical protein
MHTKLTLRVDSDLVRKAKAYGRRRGKSVSQMVADYFRLLEGQQDQGETEATPLVQSLRGVLRGAAVDETDYRDHLEDRFG